MVFLPIAVNLEDKKILIIGGGRIAAHKIRTISLYTRQIFIIAPEVSRELKDQGYSFKLKEYEADDLAGAFLVYACTNDPQVNSDIAREANERGILVNVCDQPELSVFVSPAVYKQSYMSVAVSSNGQDVHKSIAWRDRIREVLKNDKVE